ncbi:MAG: NAD-dependent epimerase/dehydratase family protein [Candidatus Brocadiales bacterium]
MKILVTGGAGFIGSHIVGGLLKDGHQVIIVDNLSTGHERNLNAQARFYKLDIRDAEKLDEVFSKERPDIVNHHAAQTDVRRSMSDPIFDAQVNVMGSLNIFNLSIKYGVKKVTFASSSAIYSDKIPLPLHESQGGDPVSVYGLTKYIGELYLRLFYDTYGLSYTAFRYGNVYGPRQDPHGENGVVAIFIGQMRSGIRPTIFGDGSKTRDYIYIDDVVKANLIAIRNPDSGGIFNLGSGSEIADLEVFNTVRNLLGVRIEPIFSSKRPGEADRVCLNIDKAETQLAWEPSIRFSEGVALTLQLYQPT